MQTRFKVHIRTVMYGCCTPMNELSVQIFCSPTGRVTRPRWLMGSRGTPCAPHLPCPDWSSPLIRHPIYVSRVRLSVNCADNDPLTGTSTFHPHVFAVSLFTHKLNVLFLHFGASFYRMIIFKILLVNLKIDIFKVNLRSKIHVFIFQKCTV